MVDIHSHILYGIQDSPKSIEVSIEIAKQYISNGFSHVVSTPHFNPASSDIDNFRNECENKLNEINERLNQENLSLSIIPGAEVMLSPEILEIQNFNYLCIRNTNYMLVEFPWRYYPIWADQVLFELGLLNIVPILAHPERNDEIFRNYDKFIQLIDSGLITQINAISLFYGTTRRRIRKLFEDNAVSFIATDTHKPDERLDCFNKAISKLNQKIGTTRTKRITRNSELVLSNENI